MKKLLLEILLVEFRFFINFIEVQYQKYLDYTKGFSTPP